jgi:hypothetical protein
VNDEKGDMRLLFLREIKQHGRYLGPDDHVSLSQQSPSKEQCPDTTTAIFFVGVKYGNGSGRGPDQADQFQMSSKSKLKSCMT